MSHVVSIMGKVLLSARFLDFARNDTLVIWNNTLVIGMTN